MTAQPVTPIAPDVIEQVHAVARRARVAARELALLTRAQKDAALTAMADAIDAATATVVQANDEDLRRGRAKGLPENLLDRLTLDEARVHAVADKELDVDLVPGREVGEHIVGRVLTAGRPTDPEPHPQIVLAAQ